MKYALFLGCSVPTRGMNYEISARTVAEKLGIEFADIPEFSCCGFPIRSVDQEAGFTMAARNLALAEKQGLNIVTLCSACTETLAEANYHFKHNPEELEKINKNLEKFGLKYSGGVEVKHFARVLWEDIGIDELKKHYVRSLEGVRLVSHYGCHYLKPSKIYDHFDDPENPRSIDELIESTGATAIRNYPEKEKCCGGAILGIKESVTQQIAKSKLEPLSKMDVDAMVLICPFCSVIYEGNQKKIAKEFGIELNIPILYLTQILGLAMGFPSAELGFKLNRIKAKGLLAKVEPKEPKEKSAAA